MDKPSTVRISHGRTAAIALQIHKATLGSNGDVTKGAPLSEPEAVTERKAGRDVVVCGTDLEANRDLAKKIERRANGTYKLCPPHSTAGPNALPHCQPNPRGPQGHTFYETPRRKAK
jgi:hypothetical protein